MHSKPMNTIPTNVVEANVFIQLPKIESIILNSIAFFTSPTTIFKKCLFNQQGREVLK
jgi:hypothetical protein